MSPQDLVSSLDNWLYAFFSERCKPVDDGLGEKPAVKKRAQRPNRALTRLRKEKNSCKRTLRALVKAGLKDTKEWNVLQKHWYSLMRRHNRLRVALLRKKKQRDAKRANRKFKENPYRFTRDLFTPIQDGPSTPTFSKDTAENYFAPLYSDKGRAHTYTPLPGMSRPPPPTMPFALAPPSFRDLSRSIRKKRNGVAPGINGL